MMMNNINTTLTSYPEYKDSGVPWLGKIPAHWEQQSLFAITQVKKTRGRPDLPLLSVYRDHGVILRDSRDDNYNPKSSDLSPYKVVEPGDLVLNKMKTWQGSLGVSQHLGIVSPAYIVCQLYGNLDHHFIHHLLRSKPYINYYNQLSFGVRVNQWDMRYDDFKRIRLFLPPPDEQQAIARFLDEHDRVTRRYIRAQQRLIKLLTEQKQALIQQAVTRGLDPDVPLKDSGIEWLGKIPEHWEVWQIGYLAKIGNGSTPSRSNIDYWQNGNYPWLNSSSVNQVNITQADQFVTPLALSECHLPIISPDSVLVAITGQGKTRGTAALLKIEATINQHIAFITPKKKILSSEYLQLFLTGAYKQLRAISQSSGSTKGALTCGDLKHFKILVPPRLEQDHLIQATKERINDIETTITCTQRRISLIREYRTRLIADVVTGKLDVRGL